MWLEQDLEPVAPEPMRNEGDRVHRHIALTLDCVSDMAVCQASLASRLGLLPVGGGSIPS
jgi:hypothetical protein